MKALKVLQIATTCSIVCGEGGSRDRSFRLYFGTGVHNVSGFSGAVCM